MKQLKWGLIGCGDIARKRVAPALRDLPNCDFTAVSRERFDLAEPFAREYGARRWFRSWKELLGDSEIEAVYIATPVDLHCEQTIVAAGAGKHVLCEKPMGLTPGECDSMISACRSGGVKLGIAYYRHFYPVVARIREIIASGEIGQAVTAQINAFEYYDPQPGGSRYWFMEKARSGGGPMFDFGCHRIEVLLNIFGEVTFARGFISRLAFDREVEDTATAFLHFKNGPNAILNVTHASFEFQDTLDIFGTQGSIHVPVLNAGTVTVKTRNGERTEKHPPHTNFHLPLIDDFTRAVLENRESGVGGDTGREVNRIEEAIYGDWTMIG
ncbi:Gfo/Idh/MocA family oxidoreductase [bacterium]|nr:Gfo/Idh/MocA family oxidoreductase [bacterium]